MAQHPPLTGTGVVYLAKYDSAGNAKWSLNTTATPGSQWPTPVVVDKSNNVYLGAQFSNASINFGPSIVTDGDPGICSNSLLAINITGTESAYGPHVPIIYQILKSALSLNLRQQ